MQLVSQGLKCSIADARTGVLHKAMALLVTQETATEEDQGEIIKILIS